MQIFLIVLSILTTIPKLVELARLIWALIKGLPIEEQEAAKKELLLVSRECRKGGSAACEKMEELKQRIESRVRETR